MLAVLGAWICLSSRRATPSTGNAQPSPAAWSPAAPFQLVTPWTSIMLTPCCADEEKELVALSATTGVNLCWVAEDQAEVAGVSGATVISATRRAVVLGSKGHRRKTFRSCRARRSCWCKIPLCHKQLWWVCCSNPWQSCGAGAVLKFSQSGHGIAGGRRREVGMHQSPVQQNTGHREKGKPRDMLGRAGDCKSTQMGVNKLLYSIVICKTWR